MRDDRPADGADGGGKALWATGADVDAVEVLAFIVQIVQNRKLQVFFSSIFQRPSICSHAFQSYIIQ
jgi:hypothetical protein